MRAPKYSQQVWSQAFVTAGAVSPNMQSYTGYDVVGAFLQVDITLDHTTGAAADVTILELLRAVIGTFVWQLPGVGTLVRNLNGYDMAVLAAAKGDTPIVEALDSALPITPSAATANYDFQVIVPLISEDRRFQRPDDFRWPGEAVGSTNVNLTFGNAIIEAGFNEIAAAQVTMFTVLERRGDYAGFTIGPWCELVREDNNAWNQFELAQFPRVDLVAYPTVEADFGLVQNASLFDGTDFYLNQVSPFAFRFIDLLAGIEPYNALLQLEGLGGRGGLMPLVTPVYDGSVMRFYETSGKPNVQWDMAGATAGGVRYLSRFVQPPMSVAAALVGKATPNVEYEFAPLADGSGVEARYLPIRCTPVRGAGAGPRR